MTDVMRLAMDRRAELNEEIARIDDFIRMADSLMRKQQPGSERVEAPGDLHESHDPSATQNREAATGVTRMNLLRRGTPAAAG